jgi:hypothetical protein
MIGNADQSRGSPCSEARTGRACPDRLSDGLKGCSECPSRGFPGTGATGGSPEYKRLARSRDCGLADLGKTLPGQILQEVARIVKVLAQIRSIQRRD